MRRKDKTRIEKQKQDEGDDPKGVISLDLLDAGVVEPTGSGRDKHNVVVVNKYGRSHPVEGDAILLDEWSRVVRP